MNESWEASGALFSYYENKINQQCTDLNFKVCPPVLEAPSSCQWIDSVQIRACLATESSDNQGTERASVDLLNCLAEELTGKQHLVQGELLAPTSVCTRLTLWERSSRTQLNISTTPSLSAMSSMMSMAMKHPVLPAPALEKNKPGGFGDQGTVERQGSAEESITAAHKMLSPPGSCSRSLLDSFFCLRI